MSPDKTDKPTDVKPNNISRREFLKTTVAGLAGASTLAAAGIDPLKVAESIQWRKRTSARAATVKLVFWQHQDPRLDAATLQKIEEYKTVAPNVEIEFNKTPHVDYEPAIIAALAGGADIDVYDIGDWNVPAFIEKGIIDSFVPEAVGLKSTQDAVDEYIAPNVLSGLMSGDKLYGFPLELSNFILYINDDHFKEVGLDPAKDYPKFWNDDFITVGKKLVKKDGDKWVRMAYNLPFFDPTWNMLVMWPFFQQVGAEILSDDGKTSLLDQPLPLQAFKNMTDLLTVHKLGDGNIGLNSPTEPAEEFRSGRLSMWQLGPWGRSMIASTPLEKSYRVVPLPQTKDGKKEATVLYSWFWTVNPKTQNREEAWKFAYFLAKDAEYWLKKLGVIQPKKNLMDTPTAKDFKFLDVILADQKKGVYMPRSNKFQQVQQAMWKATQRTGQQGISAEDSLKTAHEEITRALQA